MIQGMPVYADMLTKGISMCSFSQPAEVRAGIPFARSCHVGQAGNGMHAAMAGLCLLYAVGEVTPAAPAGLSPAMASLAQSLFDNFV